MGKRFGTNIIEMNSDSLRITCIGFFGAIRYHRQIAIQSLQDPACVEEIKRLARDFPAQRTIALIPQSICVQRIFNLPSVDLDEILNMVQIQLERSTPYTSRDMTLGVAIIRTEAKTHSLVSSAMILKDVIKPFQDILLQEGIQQDILTVNTKRLEALALRCCKTGADDQGQILGILEHGSILFGLAVCGRILLAREQKHDAKQISLDSFIELCAHEFPGIKIKGGVVFMDRSNDQQVVSSKNCLIEVRTLETLVKTPAERKAFDKSSLVFLDLLMVQSGSLNGIDLSADEIKFVRKRSEIRQLLVHFGAACSMVLFGLLIIGTVRFERAMAQITKLKESVASRESIVKDLENKAALLSAVRKYATDTISTSYIFEHLSASLAPEARLSEVDLKQGQLTIRGEAESLEAVQQFQSALEVTPEFKGVKLEGIDKRPSETGETVYFRLKVLVSL